MDYIEKFFKLVGLVWLWTRSLLFSVLHTTVNGSPQFVYNKASVQMNCIWCTVTNDAMDILGTAILYENQKELQKQSKCQLCFFLLFFF